MKPSKRPVALWVVGTLVWCSITPVGVQAQNSRQEDSCNTVAAAVGGAVIGALLGGSKSRGRGACRC